MAFTERSELRRARPVRSNDWLGARAQAIAIDLVIDSADIAEPHGGQFWISARAFREERGIKQFGKRCDIGGRTIEAGADHAEGPTGGVESRATASAARNIERGFNAGTRLYCRVAPAWV